MKQAKYLTTQQGDGHHGADSDPAHTRRVLQVGHSCDKCCCCCCLAVVHCVVLTDSPVPVQYHATGNQLELDLSSCFPAFSYVPGDAVGVRCPNREAAVAVVLAR